MFSNRGVRWDIEIHDTEYDGAATEVNGTLETFTVDWEGTTTALHTEIMPSTAQFIWQSQAYNSVHEQFIDEFSNASEERFYMRIYRGGIFWWQGWCITDETSYPDANSIVTVTISALDGIQRLRDIDYRDKENDADFTGRDTILEHIMKCIDLIGQPLPGIPTAPRFKTNIYWFAEGMNTADNAIEQCDYDHAAWISKDTNGNVKYTKAWEVLRNIAAAFEARFFFAEGNYWLMQPREYHDGAQVVWRYDRDGNPLGSGNQIFDNIIDDDIRVKSATIINSYLPPLVEYCVDYDHGSSSNLASGLYFDKNSPDEFQVLPTRLWASGDDTFVIKLRVKFRTNSDLTMINQNQGGALPPYINHRYFWEITLKIGTLIYRRIVLSSPDYWEYEIGNFSWFGSGDTGVNFLSTNRWEGNDAMDIIDEIDITTQILPLVQDTPIEFKIKLEKIEDEQGNPVTSGINLNGGIGYAADLFWATEEIYLTITDQKTDRTLPGEKTRRYCAVSDLNTNTKSDKVTVRIGDGPASFSDTRLQFQDEPTELWRRGINNDLMPLGDLNASIRLGMRRKPTELISGTLMAGDLGMLTRVIAYNNAYLALDLRFSAFYDRWTGVWGLVQYDAAGITVDIPVDLPPILEPADPPIIRVPVPQGGDIFDTGYQTPNTPPATIQTTQLTRYLSATRTFRLSPQFVNKQNAQNQIPVNPVDYVFVASGNRVRIIHPASGRSELLTVSNDYIPNDQTLDIDEDLEGDFPAGSYVLALGVPTPAAGGSSTENGGGSATETCQIQKAQNVSGSRFDITVTNFPATDAEIDSKVTLWRQGVAAMHVVNYTIDRSVNPIQLVFAFPLRGEHFVLKVCNDAAEWTEKFINYSGDSVTITAGSLLEVEDYDTQLRVTKAGVTIFENFADGYTVDEINNKLNFAKRARGEDIFIQKIK